MFIEHTLNMFIDHTAGVCSGVQFHPCSMLMGKGTRYLWVWRGGGRRRVRSTEDFFIFHDKETNYFRIKKFSIKYFFYRKSLCA